MTCSAQDVKALVSKIFADDEPSADDIDILSQYFSGVLNGQFFVRIDPKTCLPIWDVGNWDKKFVKVWEHFCETIPLRAWEMEILCHYAWFFYLMEHPEEEYPSHYFTMEENACLRSVRWCQDF